jgi:predicted outer membrane lipoprotein
MARVLLGILKGGVVGGAVGFAATRVGFGTGAAAWLVYGLVGFLVGIVCGKAIWRQDTLVTPLLKGIFGFLVGLGLYWVAGKTLGGLHLALATRLGAPDEPVAALPLLLAPAIGIIYGIFVELDDGERKRVAAQGSLPPPV